MLPYWPSMIVNRWITEQQDFQTTFWGTRLVELSGQEPTGHYLSEAGPGTSEILRATHREVLTNLTPSWLCGVFDWFDKEHQHWHQITQPLADNDQTKNTQDIVVIKTLTLMAFK
ncbi:hypothetical protein O4H49_02950 [Kiloniella laminariae]|uniref:Uncharacterized protein n=1 Tax=Kiloniella laminariae TaxID=454162 RepID=A0ABT4LH96_9PROT|nr:hypothetical protein [Kiloniella laminariae]MCZ4279721.1 hypothetical protein [Kiloniella laminariae]